MNTQNEHKADRNAPKAFWHDMTVKEGCRIFWFAFLTLLIAVPLIIQIVKELLQDL